MDSILQAINEAQTARLKVMELITQRFPLGSRVRVKNGRVTYTAKIEGYAALDFSLRVSTVLARPHSVHYSRCEVLA